MRTRATTSHYLVRNGISPTEIRMTLKHLRQCILTLINHERLKADRAHVLTLPLESIAPSTISLSGSQLRRGHLDLGAIAEMKLAQLWRGNDGEI